MPSFDTPGPTSIRLELAMADVTITAEDRNTTAIEVRPSDPTNDADVRAADSTRVEFADGEVTMKSSRLRSWLDHRGGAVDVTIHLPARSHLHGTVGMGAVTANGTFGECRLKTSMGRIHLDKAESLFLKSGAGDVTVQRVAGHADVVAATGDITVRELGSTGALKNSNGATWVGTANGDVRIHAANGAIAVEQAHGNVVAKSANGDIRLEEVVRGLVVLETQIGDLEVGIRPGTAAWLDMNARAGAVHNTLDTIDAPEAATDRVEVRGRTTLGEIVIRRPRGVAGAR